MSHIMIDPGHGGHLPGAVNKKHNLKEKDINLAVSLLVGRYLNKYHFSEADAIFTRKIDKAVSLKQRCITANANYADAFVSIHTNARRLKGRYGLELESFHSKGSRKGSLLAAAVLEQILLTFRTHAPEVKLIDRGVKVGQRWSKKKQKMCPFYVLKNTAMPAGLIEIGFLSDDEEAIILKSKKYQRMFAVGIAKGIIKYLRGQKDSTLKG